MIVNGQDNQELYFVAETKNTGDGQVDLQELRENEQLKIACAKRYFEMVKTVRYRAVKNLNELT